MENHTTTTTTTINDGPAQYEPPAVTTIGDIDDLTHGQSTGNFLDADFADGTPFSLLTFS